MSDRPSASNLSSAPREDVGKAFQPQPLEGSSWLSNACATNQSQGDEISGTNGVLGIVLKCDIYAYQR